MIRAHLVTKNTSYKKMFLPRINHSTYKLYFRRFSDPLLHNAADRGNAHLLPGAGHRSEVTQRCHRGVESGVSVLGGDRHQQRRCFIQRCPLLQYHHRLVSLLLRPGTQPLEKPSPELNSSLFLEFPSPTALGRVSKQILLERVLRS